MFVLLEQFPFSELWVNLNSNKCVKPMLAKADIYLAASIIK